MPQLLIILPKTPVATLPTKPDAPAHLPAAKAMRRAVSCWVYEGGAGGDVV